MKILKCPLNGPRNISEFVWGGEVKPMPDPAAASDEAWTEFLFLEENIAGEIYEWWLHAPTNYWFIARRNTITDTVLETMTFDTFRAREPALAATGLEPAKPAASGPNTGASAV